MTGRDLSGAEGRAVEAAERAVGLRFRDKRLLVEALTHTSCHSQSKGSYERLEFLGDSVLGFVVSELVFERDPHDQQGILSKLKGTLVSGRTLAAAASEMGLKDAVLVGRGLDMDGGREAESILADVLEALIGAVYLDQGLDAAKRLVLSVVEPWLGREDLEAAVTDAKSELQELIMARGGAVPDYRIIEEEGPPHDRTFTAAVYIAGAARGAGVGRSKKEAEQMAAAEALVELQREG